MKRVNSTSSELNDFTETEDGKKEYNVYNKSFTFSNFIFNFLFFQVSRSRLISLINIMHVIEIYLPVVWLVAFALLAMQIAPVLYEYRSVFVVSAIPKHSVMYLLILINSRAVAVLGSTRCRRAIPPLGAGAGMEISSRTGDHFGASLSLHSASVFG
jgi:hypothetical protein